MRWVDVMGVSGVGKSTLCTPWCNPNDYPQEPTATPPEWAEFIECCRWLCDRVEVSGPGGGRKGTWRRTQNAIWRMAHIARMPGPKVYCNVGIAHRGISIAWRLRDPSEIVEFYRLMPVSIGVACLVADADTIVARNLERGKTIRNKERSKLALRMMEGIPHALEAMRARGLALLLIDTTKPVAENVARLRDFAGLPPLAADPAAA